MQTFHNEGDKRYLSIPVVGKVDRRVDFELKMLAGNQPSGLLAVHRSELDGRTILDYDISGLRPLTECRENLAAHLYSIVLSLEKAADTLKEYMLRPEGLVLDPEKVFFREESGQTLLLYDPAAESTLQRNLSVLMEYFLKVLVPTDEKEVLLLYGLYNCTREENVTLTALAAFWRNSGTREILSAEKEASVPEGTLSVYKELGLAAEADEDPPSLSGNCVNARVGEEHSTSAGLEEYVSQEPPFFQGVKNYFMQYRFECCVIMIVMVVSVFLLLR